MKLKASLHLHTAEDRSSDGPLIGYSIYQLIDRAALLGFKVLGLTCHRVFVYRRAYGRYAKQRGILLLPGVELELAEMFNRPHVVVLNCGPDIEKVTTLNELAAYKKRQPQIFVLAAHPLVDRHFSLAASQLEECSHLFDAFEHTWFYSRWFNSNRRVAALARRFHKPFLATADLHHLKYLSTDYAVIDSREFSAAAIFAAIKAGRFSNVSRPKFWLPAVLLVLYLFAAGRVVLTWRRLFAKS